MSIYFIIFLEQVLKLSFLQYTRSNIVIENRGWSCGAKVLGKLSVPGRPTNVDNSRTRAYCSCSSCGWGMFGHCFSRLSFLFSFSLSGRRPDRRKYCLKGPLNPKQLTNQPIIENKTCTRKLFVYTRLYTDWTLMSV